MKRCYFCRGEIIQKRVQHIHIWADRLILFKEVPAEVCKQCGEIYFSPEVVEMIDKAVAKTDEIKNKIEVPVVGFSELAEV